MLIVPLSPSKLISCYLISLIVVTSTLGQNETDSRDVDSPPSYNSSVNHVTLRLVTIVLNEGLSTPSSTFAHIDPYLRPEFWPDGVHQITSTGKRQLFELGKLFRSRYHDFLTDSPREVYARSSDADNNIEGALVFLHGAYKAHGVWKYGNTDYLPIAVHSVPTENDCVLSTHCKCPRIKQVINGLLSSPEADELKKHFESTLKLVESKTGLTSFWQQIDYVETVLNQVALQSKIPSWITPGVIDEFDDLANGFHSMATAYPDMLKLMVGSLYSELAEKLESSVASAPWSKANKQEKPRFLLYSTLTPILSSVVYHLSGVNGVIPPAGSFFILELFEAPGSSFFTKMFYWNDTNSRHPNLLHPTFPSQSQSATSPLPLAASPLNDLLAHIKTLTEPDWSAYCGLSSSTDSGLDTLSLVLTIILCIVFASVICTIVAIVRKSRSGYVIFK